MKRLITYLLKLTRQKKVKRYKVLAKEIEGNSEITALKCRRSGRTESAFHNAMTQAYMLGKYNEYIKKWKL